MVLKGVCALLGKHVDMFVVSECFFVFAVSGEFITVLLRVKFKRGAAKSLAEDTSELAEEDQTDQHEPTAA